MMKQRRGRGAPVGIGDEAVRRRTGKGWDGWFRLLDRSGARRMSHREIAAHLHLKLGCPGWWNQMVAVAYERERGMRERHQTPRGYSISRSRTLPFPAARIFRACKEKKERDSWLGEEKLAIGNARAGKSLRMKWVDGKSNVEIRLDPRGRGKCQISVEHSGLPGAVSAERRKRYWGRKLDRLRDFLEG
jgi:hypothetical protein